MKAIKENIIFLDNVNFEILSCIVGERLGLYFIL